MVGGNLSLAFLRFHVARLFTLQPFIFSALVLVCVGLILAGSIFVHFRWEHKAALAEWKSLQALASTVRTATAAAPSDKKPDRDLPEFDNVLLVQSLNEFAEDNQLPLGEVSYALDESVNQPYLRYRILLKVAASYPRIRKFSEQFTAEMSNASLDSINCSRSSNTALVTTCDLAFSVFYRRGHRA